MNLNAAISVEFNYDFDWYHFVIVSIILSVFILYFMPESDFGCVMDGCEIVRNEKISNDTKFGIAFSIYQFAKWRNTCEEAVKSVQVCSHLFMR